ncbi:MAG: alpha/beta hydrolase [Candidatus Aureabacteria bacterium]|nr:alpha/beta hydrolase [Candidatus Auribacterota bacterium]
MKISYVFIEILALAGIIYLSFRWFEWRHIFHPDKKISELPGDFGIKYEDITFYSIDDKKLNGWFIPADKPAATIIYCHGNAGNISHRIDIAQLLHSLGFNVFLFDYRGYGKSKGIPGEKGLYLDAEAAYDYLSMRDDIDKDRIVLYGESLGGGVVYNLALKREVFAVITFGAFASIADMADAAFPKIPLKYFITMKFDNISKVKAVKCPKLIMHSIDDTTVPFEQAKRLFETASNPKEFFETAGGHTNDALLNNKKFGDKTKNFISRIF